MMKREWSDKLCRSFLFGEMVLSTFIVLLAELVLVFRVWILYHRSKRLQYFLVALVIGEIIASFTVGVYTVKPLRQFVHDGLVLLGCYSLSVPRIFTFYALPPFIMSIIMFTLTAYKCGASIVAFGPRRTPFLAIFMRDGLFWFLAFVVIGIGEIILWPALRPTLAQVPVLPGVAAAAIMSTRVILNVKTMYTETSNVIEDGDATMAMQLQVRRSEGTSRVHWTTNRTEGEE
ncbi:hypothetical protein R3P38DRAFT_95642 [Favolaschia claudopus]|uniref:Uncharacterized protein n=1 Tax=Favolaschia claudopus TaxID=2862362 RepID=A0AAW0D7C0_9AGAR